MEDEGNPKNRTGWGYLRTEVGNQWSRVSK